MISQLARQRRSAAYQVVFAQLGMTLLMSGLGYLVWGREAAMLTAKGGSIATVPSFVFATLAFYKVRARDAVSVLGLFYLGVTIKLMLTMVLFTYVLSTTDLAYPGALFVGYIGALMAHWAAPLFFK
ncbi:ATP synthase I chain [Ferrimonas balearica DSM 9799]|uniref:ATP synthase I chain n=1 Tax=Ferrimonas balearica (strain DSM 9799 / CCM 4581 / KCTC 23876 / PAT) TaxID=550540 RepID=E1SR56_FERBD|nr:ATP synthase subunit I [Ferrimonas balearica]ADN77986.1 ATP synthase I chain [Ferrimonas balearica DSM 9799]MBY6108729.1 ATP synthase subunit I [Ferrimonas balearica]